MEYQLPTPRPPMLRVPTALTSSSLPVLMWGSSASPGEGRASVCFCFASSFASFAFFSSFLVSSGVDGLSALVMVGGRGVGGGAGRRGCRGICGGRGAGRLAAGWGAGLGKGECRGEGEESGKAKVRCGTHGSSPLRAGSLLTDAAQRYDLVCAFFVSSANGERGYQVE